MAESDDDSDGSQWRVVQSDFLQMIPGPNEDRLYRGGKLRLLSIELYQKGIVVTWLAHSYSRSAHAEAIEALRQDPNFAEYVEDAFTEEGGSQIHLPPAPFVPEEWTAISWHIENAVREWLVPMPDVTDDRGNAYRPRHGSSEGETAYRETWTLEPGIPPNAHVLILRFRDERFTVPIPLRA